MPSPNVSIFEEISDQNLDGTSAGNAALQIRPTWIGTANCIISNAIGNPGGICTLTVECQNNCN